MFRGGVRVGENARRASVVHGGCTGRSLDGSGVVVGGGGGSDNDGRACGSGVGVGAAATRGRLGALHQPVRLLLRPPRYVTISYGHTAGPTARGRPSRKWVDNDRDDGLTSSEVTRLAADRRAWRSAVYSLGCQRAATSSSSSWMDGWNNLMGTVHRAMAVL